MSEWLKEHAWKACVGVTLPRVRIPLSPPEFSPRTSWKNWSIPSPVDPSAEVVVLGSIEVENYGEVPEWSNGAVSKTVDRASGPWVRIPPSPPDVCLHRVCLPRRVRSRVFRLSFENLMICSTRDRFRDFESESIGGFQIALSVRVISTPFEKVQYREAYVSTQQSSSQEESRLPFPHAEQAGSRYYFPSSSQRAQAPSGLIGDPSP